MNVRSFHVLCVCAFLGVAAAVAACDDGNDHVARGARPTIVRVEGPSLEDGGVRDTAECNIETANDGACPITIKVVFRLPQDQFIWKAYVRFQGDGNDVGVDRAYVLDPRFGGGDIDQTVAVHAAIPPNVLRVGGLLTYSIRLLSGAGEQSEPSTQSLSLQQIKIVDAGTTP